MAPQKRASPKTPTTQISSISDPSDNPGVQSASQTPDLEAQSEEAKPAVLPGQISLDAAAKRQVWDQLAERAMGKQLKTRTGGELHGRLEGALRASAVARMSP